MSGDYTDQNLRMFRHANPDFKPNFIAWYEDEFQADRLVQRMTPNQQLLCGQLTREAYYNSERPYLPNDDNILWVLAKADSLEHWMANKDAILVKFTVVLDEDGREFLRNKRVIFEWEKMVGQLEQRKHAGAASARKRAEKKSAKKKEKNQKKEENITQPDPTLPNLTLPKSVEHSSTVVDERSTVVQEAEKTEGRKDGLHAPIDSRSKPSASGQQTFKDRAQIALELKWIEYVNHFRTERGITADDEPDDYPPPGLNTSGIAKLVEVLKQDGWSVDEAGDAFYRFLREQYDRDFDTDRIKKPLSIFARDLQAYRAVIA